MSKYKAKKTYGELPNEKNFLALGSASTHLKLVAGESVEISDQLLPLSKDLEDCLTEIKAKKEK
jgi:hypothetical protein|tara:strand:+ start:1161 stop:1352 length:192 start_codon:yes stop_codon:yes gene_type:complete